MAQPRSAASSPYNHEGQRDDDGRDQKNHLWLDRARVFQGAVSQLTPDYGAVDLAINDYVPINPKSIVSTNPPEEVDHIAGHLSECGSCDDRLQLHVRLREIIARKCGEAARDIRVSANYGVTRKAVGQFLMAAGDVFYSRFKFFK